MTRKPGDLPKAVNGTSEGSKTIVYAYLIVFYIIKLLRSKCMFLYAMFV